MIELECRCGKKFERNISEHKRSLRIGRKEYCSLSCGRKYQVIKKKPKVKNLCKQCGEETTNPSFCGSSCAATYNNTDRLGEINCLGCGKAITENRSRHRKYCSNKCQALYKNFVLIESGNYSPYAAKTYLINQHGAKCMDCGWGETNPFTKKIPIELEHIDGNGENNTLDNLKLLCPNCHSLTSTYKGANAGKGRHSRRQRYKEGKSY